MTPPRDASSNLPWPPLIYGAAFFVALGLRWLAPLPLTRIAALQHAGALLGVALFLAGAVIALAAESSFLRAGTATLPTRPTSSIVDGGFYRYTRNPMYLGMSLALAGIGLYLNSPWFLLALPCAVFAVTKLAIEREEAYLEAKFGAAYLAYKHRVRRWL